MSEPLKLVRELAFAWATQSTDYDDDTETQIRDGMKLLAVLADFGLVTSHDIPAHRDLPRLFEHYRGRIRAGGLSGLWGTE